MFAFKLFQSATFGVFINKCDASMLQAAMTNIFIKLMEDHPELPKEVITILKEDEYGYDTEALKRTNKDLMKIVYNSPRFPFLDHVMNAENILSIEDILKCSVDVHKDYKKDPPLILVML